MQSGANPSRSKILVGLATKQLVFSRGIVWLAFSRYLLEIDGVLR